MPLRMLLNPKPEVGSCCKPFSGAVGSRSMIALIGYNRIVSEARRV